MYSLSVKNEQDQILNLTESKAYDVLKIDGLAPVSAVLGLQELAGYDGAMYSNCRVGTRNIVITLAIHEDVETNRLALYKYFSSKKSIRIYYKNSARDVYIDGFVESFECDYFTMSQQCQISIICPNPYFKQKNEIEITYQETISLFEFPFEVPLSKGIEFSETLEGYNAVISGGDVESGIIFEITALETYATFLNPGEIIITNKSSSQKMILERVCFLKGDKIYINTFKGYKQMYINRRGEIINIIGNLYSGSRWLNILPGENILNIKDDIGELHYLKVICQAFKYYEGV